MTIYDPYTDPDRVPTTVHTGRRARSTRSMGQPAATPATARVSRAPTANASDPHATHMGGQILDRDTEPSTAGGPADSVAYQGRPPQRSAILTAIGSFVSLSIIPLTVILTLLIWMNQELCADGLSTIECQGTEATVNGLIATAITGVAALIVSMVGGGRIKRAHNTAGLVLVVVATAAMAILIAWLRQTLGVPFPF